MTYQQKLISSVKMDGESVSKEYVLLAHLDDNDKLNLLSALIMKIF